MRREPGSGSSGPNPSKKLIEMQNATDSGSGHGPDPQIFMRTPDSHRIRTIRYGPPPTDPIGLELFICKGKLGILDFWVDQGMLCPETGPCHLGPVVPKLMNTIFYYHFMVIPPELTRYGRASIPTRLESLGLFLRMPRCLSWNSNADKPELFWCLIRIWRLNWESNR